MKKLGMLLALIAIFALGGCRYFIPGEIKREISYVKVVTNTAITETEAAPTVEQRAKIAKKALDRLAPHLENLDRYAQGKPSEAVLPLKPEEGREDD